MKITNETTTTLTVKTHDRTLLWIFGIILLLAGILIVTFIRARTLTVDELRPPQLIFQTDPDAVPLEDIGKDATFRFAYDVTQRTVAGRRPFILLGALAVIGGLIIVLGPHRGSTFVFDKDQQSLTMKHSRSFFRTHTEQVPLGDISEVRVERDRARNSKNGQNYGVNLVVSHTEGTPLTRNYINYKTVHPLSAGFHFDYEQCQALVDRIWGFVNK